MSTAVTRWEIAASLDAVWDEINTPQHWPDWWRAVLAVQQLEAGDGNGLGAYSWMRPLVPMARPIFAWNHDVVMAWGRQGLSSRIEQRRSDCDRHERAL